MSEIQKRLNSDLSEIKMFKLYQSSFRAAQEVEELYSVLDLIGEEPDPSRVFQSIGNENQFYQVKTTILIEGD